VGTLLVDRPLERSLGAGEASTGPTPAAIGNAVFAATGVRLRELPFTPDRVRQAAGRTD
jgi:CO/xanthine dehydrogenase Mo-binding subunit